MKLMLYLALFFALFVGTKILYWFIGERLLRYWHRARHPCPQCRSRTVVRVPQVYAESDASRRFPDEVRTFFVELRQKKGVRERARILRRLFTKERCAVYVFRTCGDCRYSWCRSYTAFFPFWRLVYMVCREPECFQHRPELFKAVGLHDPHSFLGQRPSPRTIAPLPPL